MSGLLQRAIDAQEDREQRFLQAMAVCHLDGFWLPLVAQAAGLSETDTAASRDRLMQASLIRLIDQERQQFRLHALLREQLLESGPIAEFQNTHVETLEALFADWETRWQDCRACLAEIIPAMHVLWAQGESNRMQWLSFHGYAVARRIGELESALRILHEQEGFWFGGEDNASKDSLQQNYGNQALILQDWGKLDEAMALHKKEEALCLELGLRSSLAYCYWSWGLLAREQENQLEEGEKLQAAYTIFDELNMQRERQAVKDELDE